VARKIILVAAALIIPGGLVALLCAWLGRAFSQTERGRRAIRFARQRVPAWMSGWSAPALPERVAA
jgi:hypothetical protein